MNATRDHVAAWVAAYERYWRGNAVDQLATIFTEDAQYWYDPYQEPLIGLDAIREFWTEDDVFTVTSDIVAVEGDTGVVRLEVHYGETVGHEYRDLWVIRFAADGRCRYFEEWPFWPGKGHSATG
ncbi:MAG: nuclear transport factor 2 family protein [Candidatus Nanopelagicales bacterium]